MKKRFLPILTSVLILSMFASSTSFAVMDTNSTENTSVVTSISLTQGENGYVYWNADQTSSKGFKAVWSKTENPTYPTRSTDKYKYYSDPSTTSSQLEAFDGDGTYYVRVCEYLSGKCGTYSNQIQVSLSGSSKTETKKSTEYFEDVEKTHENSDAIKYFKTIGVVVGYEDGTYKPEQAINRAEFLKIIMMAVNIDVSDQKNCFNDVTTQWYAPYVCGAKEMNLIHGYGDGYFRPERNIKFAEASKIIALAFNTFLDDELNEQWFQKYVIALEELFAIPTSVSSFDKNITRGEMAEIAYRVKTQNFKKTSASYESLKTGDGSKYVNYTKETQTDETKEDQTTEESEVKSITLSIIDENMVGWETDGYSASGYKVVYSKTTEPTYPTRDSDKYQYLSSPDADSAEIDAFDGEGTYYVRVCEYLGGKCKTYSNEIELDIQYPVNEYSQEDPQQETLTEITLTQVENGEISWEANGYSSSGYKVVYSKTTEPTYPTRDSDKYQYLSSPDADSAEIDAFDGIGTYYVRVCEYTGGGCGVYSNEITIDLQQ